MCRARLLTPPTRCLEGMARPAGHQAAPKVCCGQHCPRLGWGSPGTAPLSLVCSWAKQGEQGAGPPGGGWAQILGLCGASATSPEVFPSL